MTNKTKRYSVGFTQVPNSILNQDDLSLSAKGLYAFMNAKPDSWNFTIKSMAKQLKEGMTAIGNYLNELKESGWIMYEKHNDGYGTYHIFTDPETQNPNLENPNLENPNLQKPKRISNKDSIAINSDSKKDGSLPEHAVAVRPQQKQPAETTFVFNAYCEGMRQVYGQNITPARNAKSNAMLKKMIERIGLDQAILVARNYPHHKNRFYVQRVHAIESMLNDCESLMIQVQSGQMVTSTSAYQADKQGHFQNEVNQNALRYDDSREF